MLNGIRRLFGAERRQYERRQGGDVQISIDGEQATVVDWSAGGFRIGRLTRGSPRRGSYIKGRVKVGRTGGRFTAYVVAVHPDGGIGARYDEIDSKVFNKLL